MTFVDVRNMVKFMGPIGAMSWRNQLEEMLPDWMILTKKIWLVVSTPLKNISQLG